MLCLSEDTVLLRSPLLLSTVVPLVIREPTMYQVLFLGCLLPSLILTKPCGLLLLCCYYGDYYHYFADGNGGVGGMERLGNVAQDHMATAGLSNTVTSSHMLLPLNLNSKI